MPGPDSIINCIVQSNGPGGPTRFLTVQKQSALSQIPGLNYGFEALSNISKPETWEIQKLNAATLQSIKLSVLGTDVFDPGLNALQKELHKDLDLKLLPLIKFCEEGNVTTASMLKAAPQNVKELL